MSLRVFVPRDAGAIAVGANDYILKPFNREMIKQKLAEIEAAA